MQKESFLHFIWKFGLFDKENFYTIENEKVEIISLGIHNTDAGPDFLNAKLRIGETIWAGNVEMHHKTSDWYKHAHHTNEQYNNVILHVVTQQDGSTLPKNGNAIPTALLRYNLAMEEQYKQLMDSQALRTCSPFIKELDSFQLRHFLSRLLVERLEKKAKSILDTLSQTENDWRQAFHRLLFRSFGFNTNASAFELLAQCTPPQAIAKHRNSLIQIEALLFGQAGFLNEKPTDEYQAQLAQEYAFLQRKFDLHPMEKHVWMLLRMRPGNFPTIRIAQLAMLLHKTENLADRILSHGELQDYETLLDVTASNYWDTHYLFGKESARRTKSLGKQSIERIIINTLVPYLFTYGMERKNEALKEKSLRLLEQLPAEQNSVLEQWQGVGIKAENGFFSQALLQMKKEYCDKKRCLACIIGKQIVTRKKA